MDVFSMNFGRNEVIIGASKAKFCRESFGQVRFCVAPQKPGKTMEKLVFETKQMSNKNILVSKNQMLGIVWNVFSQILKPNGAKWEG